MAKSDKKLHFHCQCGRALEANWKARHLFGKKEWIADKCPICRTAKDLTGAGIVICPHCESLVLKGEKFCAVCMQPVDISTESVPVECPNLDCGMTIYLPKNYKGDYTCRYCDRKISEAKIRELLKDNWVNQNAPAKLIELPTATQMQDTGVVIHQVEGSSFPRNSHLQVGEATWALLMQNGVGQYPLGPGTHQLETSGLSLAAKLDAAAKGEDIIFNTTIFCVAKKLPEIQHTVESTPVAAKPVGKAPAREYTVAGNEVTLRCTVDDAKAFMSNVGFKAMKKLDFQQKGSWMMAHTGKVLTKAFDDAAHTAFEIWDASKSVYAYQAEILRLVKSELSSILSEAGLCLEDISLQSLAVEETEESKAKQAKYLQSVAEIETVKLPDEQTLKANKLIIYKHDKDEYAYQSRVQVSEGTYGLMFKNGACQDVLVPGSHLLADCNLDRGAQYDAAMQGENVTFTTNLFALRKNLPAIEWYRASTFIDLDRDGDAPAREYTVKAQGSITFRVDDAKAFAGVVGFRQLTVAELIHQKRPNGQLPMLNRELEKDYPAENENGWLYEKITTAMNAVMGGVCQAVFGSKLDTRRMDMYRLPFTRRLQEDFSAMLYGTGLSIAELNLTAFSAIETEVSQKKQLEYQQKAKAREAVLAAAQSRISWGAHDIVLHVKDRLDLTATVSFTGDCRLQVENEATFLQLPEVAKALAGAAPEGIAAVLKNKVEGMIRNKITATAQQFIDNGTIADLENSVAYTALANYVKAELDRDLSADGLGMQQLALDTPAIRASKALQDYKSIDDKKQKIKAYAESELKLQTAPVRVHMKDDSTVYVKAIFFGKAHLRVADESVFFATSEVQQFLSSDPFVTSSAVTSHYTERLNSMFADITSRIVQAVIDQTNADIQELNRLSGLLQSNLLNNLNARANSFGMRLDSLDMGDPSIVEQSSNMLTWVKRNETKSGNALDQEIQKLNNDKVIFEYGEDGRITVAKLGIDDQTNDALTASEIHGMENQSKIADKAAELRKQEADRRFNEEMDRIRKQGELDRLMDEIASGKEDRNFDRLQKEYQRKYQLQEAAINQAIREAQLRQQGDIDAQARQQKAEFERMVNEAENKRLLNDIMRKIDESDLDWRKKLDEYARMQRHLSVEDQVDLDVLVAQGKAKENEVSALSDLRIEREANEVFMLVGGTKIKLADAEAELMEKIARYNEDRRKRIDDTAADRAERKAILDFEQRMRDRQEQVAQEMEKLKQQYDHELALRDRDDKLSAMQYEQNKLVHILNHLSHELTTRADVDKARFDAEKEIEKAKAQYDAQHAKDKLDAEEKRWQEQLKHDEATAQRAENYQKLMAQLQLDLEKLRHDTQRNQNDNEAKVGIAQAQNTAKQEIADVKHSIERLGDRMDKRYQNLHNDMDKIRNAHNDLKRRVKDLTKGQQPYWPPMYTTPTPVYAPTPAPVAPQNPWQPPHTPTGGGYGYSKEAPLDLATSGGLGQNLSPDALNSALDAMVQGMSGILGGAVAGAQQQPAAPAKQESAPFSFGLQPGMSGTCTCPSCGKICSSSASICEHCGHSI